MVEIQCPACGAAGRAPKEKIQTRLVCRKCLKVFHISPSGKTVLGEPPVPGQTAAVSHAKAAPDSTENVDQWFERASRRLFSPSTMILAVGLILLALAAVIFRPRSPETLQDRVAKAANAAVQGDLQALRELAVPETTADVVVWFVAIRPKCDDMLQRLGSRKLAVETEVKQQDPAQESAEVVAQVSMVDELERKGNVLPDATIVVTLAGPPVSLSMAWKSGGMAGWQLDGKRTLELLKAPP